MASIKLATTSASTVITTGLNSLADDANAISSELNNATNLYLFDDVELYTAALGYSPSAGAAIELYLVEALDGTNYEDGDASIDPPSTNLVGVFLLRSTTSAQRHVIRQISLPPTKYKYVIINKSGGALAASSNTLKVKSFYYESA
jgi:hypothetical protein